MLALVASTVYLVWRWGFTLDGAAWWLGAPLAVAETYGLAMLALLAFSCWRFADRAVPPPLTGRRVAILIATFNEPADVLRPTVVGALRVRNDVRPEVWVLDDGDREWVREMCADLGVRYLCRPAPRAHAKAGNINHALTHVDAEFIVTLDADHVPRPELLERMLGYFADEGVALVQAPQTFYNRGFQHAPGEEDPLRNEQSIFFDAICRGKDRHNAAFWCGCPSVLRRAALMSVGGVATTTVVEDAHTTLQLHARGWRTVYHPEMMALGLAPEEIGAFVVQRGRWARGSLQMMRRDMPLLKRGLSWSQRFEYMANCMHFLEGPQRLIGFLVPAAVLFTGAAPIAAAPWLYALVFAPQLILTPLASRELTDGRYRLLEGERYSVVRMEAYLTALTALVTRRGASFQVTPKGARDNRRTVNRALRLPIALAAVTVAALGYQTAAQVADLPGRLTAGAHVVTVLWAVANVALIASVVSWARSVHHRRRSHRFVVDVEAAYGLDEGPASLTAHVADLSRHGARIVVAERRMVGERLRLVLLLMSGPVELRGAVATATPGPERGTWTLGIDFDALPDDTADAVIEWCFRHPFGSKPVADSPAEPAPEVVRAARQLQLARDEAAASSDGEEEVR
ncbi:MAG: glycosyltransferase [Thermoleophilia bacterium]